ncbi:IS3 family transposase [Piscirickettsia salmonis]|nr:Transposase [Piscirickettsiaceae bacterium NZ-RLO1]
MKDKKQYKRYSTAFKEEAVALVTEQGYSVQKAADSLGIRVNLRFCRNLI